MDKRVIALWVSDKGLNLIKKKKLNTNFNDFRYHKENEEN